MVARRSQPARARLLVLGAGPAQWGLLEAARARGDLDIVAADRDPDAVGFALADVKAYVSTHDEVAIERLADKLRVDGIIAPGADWPVGIAARIADRLGLPHPIDPATATLATSKLRQRERFREAGVPHAADVDADSGIVFPVVVKAADRQGQRGLTLVESSAELAKALEVARAEAREGDILVEELVEGPEVTVIGAFDVEGAFHDLAVTDRIVAEPPAFGVALAHVWPSVEALAPAVDIAEKACRAIGIEQGPVYVQLRIGEDGPRVMEVAARLGGGHDAELVRAVTGIDLNGIAITCALGETRTFRTEQPPPTLWGGACIRFLVPPPGRLVATHGTAEAEAQPGVAWVRTYRRPGWAFGPFRRGADRAGAVLALGVDRDEASARALRAAEAVRFEVDAATA